MTQDRPLGMLRYVMTVGLLMLFASLWLSVWVIHQGPGQKRFFNPWAKGSREYVVWTPLEQEKKLYAEAGYAIQWLDGEGFVVLREWLGPYAGIFEMLALRGFGLWLMAPTILLAAVVGVCEGRVAYHEKYMQFGNVSSTRFRLFVLVALFCTALFMLYLTLPFGSILPGIGAIPLTVEMSGTTIWTTSPMLWVWPFAGCMGFVAHQLAANLSGNLAEGIFMQRIKIPLLAFCLVLATTRAALAFTAPSAGDMWYTMYEVFYDRLVAGPLGGLLTGGVLAWGLAAAIRGQFATFVLCTCTAGVLFKLEDVVTGFGLVC